MRCSMGFVGMDYELCNHLTFFPRVQHLREGRPALLQCVPLRISVMVTQMQQVHNGLGEVFAPWPFNIGDMQLFTEALSDSEAEAAQCLVLVHLEQCAIDTIHYFAQPQEVNHGIDHVMRLALCVHQCNIGNAQAFHACFQCSASQLACSCGVGVENNA